MKLVSPRVLKYIQHFFHVSGGVYSSAHTFTVCRIKESKQPLAGRRSVERSRLYQAPQWEHVACRLHDFWVLMQKIVKSLPLIFCHEAVTV